MDTKTLIELSNLKEAGMYGPFFNWRKYDNQSKEELTLEDVEEALKKEYGPVALEFALSKWGEDISVAELEFLRDNSVEGNKILEAWADLEDSDLENDNILPYFADNILKEVPEEFVDKNQTKLFEDETDEMISNNLITFDSSIEALGSFVINFETVSYLSKGFKTGVVSAARSNRLLSMQPLS
jgi:hypothetical protein